MVRLIQSASKQEDDPMKKAGVMILSMMMVAILTVTNMSGAYQAASVIYAAEDGNAGSEEKQEETPDAGGAPVDTTVLPVDGNDTSKPGGANTPGPGEDEQQNTPAPSVMLTLPAVDEDNLKTPEQARIAPAPQVFTVTFDANGHGSAPAAVSVETGKSIVKPDEPVAEGFTFCGWFRDAAATVLWNFDSDVVSENITLYAGWTENAPDSTTRLPENPNEENELVTNGEGEHGNAPVEGGNEPGNHAEESNIVSTPVSNGENIVPTDTTNEEESTTTQDALNITGASESGQEASALQTSTMLRSAAPVLKAPLQNGGLRAGQGQGVYLTLKYEGSGAVVASTYTGTEGATVDINAYPGDGYRFQKWELLSGTGSIGDEDNANTTFTMGTTDATVKAVFEILPAGGNSLVCFAHSGGTASATVNPNDPTTYALTATPASGYQFEHWYISQGS
ncbi:MAG: InlB B-repeat-containing protein, partial [Lachnospiraceae bacterium]|nr:InlB B-repeat-containing protein [Lachnospiraceae bacterium]